MFTGIIEERGTVTAIEHTGDAARITVRGPLAVTGAGQGDSIAVSGVCLTVVEHDDEAFTADVMAETLAMSTLADVAAGTAVNLERAAQLGDRLGGHIVQGHVDGTATVLSLTEGSAWRVVRFRLDRELAPLVARKGSIAVDGVSLTVSAVGSDAGGSDVGGSDVGGSDVGSSDVGGSDVGGSDVGAHWFEVSLIPETLTVTTLGALKPGDRVNIETDILARHVQRMLSFGDPTHDTGTGTGTGTAASTETGTAASITAGSAS